MTQAKMWYGIEQEGYRKGMRTLFIASPKVTVKQILDNIKKYDIEQLYFGAGGCTKFDAAVIGYFLNYDFKKDIEITVEIAWFSQPSKIILDKCNIILTQKNPTIDLLKPFDSIKIESDNELIILRILNGKVLLKDNFLRKNNRYKDDKVIL